MNFSIMKQKRHLVKKRNHTFEKPPKHQILAPIIDALNLI